MPTIDVTSIEIPNGISVTVPASPKYLTTFILLEQRDWFEDEIHFIRQYIKPGMKVIDIGANYGLYTLTIAKIVGENGVVWAFEPTKSTFSCLKNSIESNGFSNVTLLQSGLSDRAGEARLYLAKNSELNSLSAGAVSGSNYETISLTTLDVCKVEYGWDNIDFIKLDAEGEEKKIIEQSQHMLDSLSPLIMYELKHKSEINIPLISKFTDLGYESYRLVPGLNILIPFDRASYFDRSLLNLFCCKRDLAEKLIRDEVIVDSWQHQSDPERTQTKKYFAEHSFGPAIMKELAAGTNNASEEYLDTLEAYLVSQSDQFSSASRVGALMYAVTNVKQMIEEGERGIDCLSTFARIAIDGGERALGVTILKTLISLYHESTSFEITVPFLPAVARYDHIDPGATLDNWLLSSIMEQWVIKHAYSIYFSKQAALPVFQASSKLGFFDEDMDRRYQLMQSFSNGSQGQVDENRKFSIEY